tara:strand:+ start:1093 stop:1356 length:264 start_codon:yes stop_codon:yes gene_type:complete
MPIYFVHVDPVQYNERELKGAMMLRLDLVLDSLNGGVIGSLDSVPAYSIEVPANKDGLGRIRDTLEGKLDFVTRVESVGGEYRAIDS